ncbi:hypothetical protein EW146_g6782 [Bondarzewia mesenterica]|uniref:Uncharacterized protein n=1 Tax=Bondarzewia mesenterica TaxID=1095465 RepID=A0A4S4LMJ2_9AGAM|nr:hypothetical protein EW146_g6782 [Bondarzewia mesenterica]
MDASQVDATLEHPADTSANPRQETYDHPDQTMSVAADDKAETSSLPPLPEIPPTDLDFSLTLESIIGPSSFVSDKVQKRASNVLKLSEENEKLKAQLRAMSERLEAAERRRAELDRKARERASGVKADASRLYHKSAGEVPERETL